MADKKNRREGLKGADSAEIIERLNPSSTDEVENAVDFELTEDQAIDDQFIDHLFQDKDKTLDHSADGLFDEDRKSFQKGLQDEVQKALSQPEISKANLFRMRAKEPSEVALSEEIATQKTVEEIWEEAAEGAGEASNNVLVIVICIFITLSVMVGGWVLWQSSNDEIGNEENLTVLENESKENEGEPLTLGEEISVVSGVVDRYFTAKTVSQKSEYIYMAESFNNEIEAYYKNNGGVKPVLDYSIENIFPINLNGEQIWQVVIENKQNLKKGLRSYYVRKNSDGDYRVDWKADVIFQENEVGVFKETRSREATSIKFILNPMNRGAIYNWGFKDTEYQVFRLVIPNSDMVFYGYVKRRSSEQNKLNGYVKADLKNFVLNQVIRHEFVLKVRFLADSPSENDQYIIIDEVVSRKWINIDE